MKKEVLYLPLMLISAFSARAGTTLISASLNNGSFELDASGSTLATPSNVVDDVQFWTGDLTALGFYSSSNCVVYHAGSVNNVDATDGSYAARVGKAGKSISVLRGDTGYPVQSGDSFDLSFDCEGGFGWLTNGVIQFYLYTEANQSTPIYSGTITGLAKNTPHSFSVAAAGTVGAADVGGNLIIEFNANASNQDYYFLDNVNLSVSNSAGPVEITESMFFTDTIGSVDQVVSILDYGANGSDTSNDSTALQNAINAMTVLPNGGKITVPAGTFYLSGIVMKSNVHIEIDSGATIIPPNRSTMFIFGTDADALSPIQNTSIRGKGGSYTVEISWVTPWENMNPVNCKSVDNFMIADMHVIDNWTDISCVTLNAAVSGGNYNMSRNGVIKNISAVSMAYGYGIMQMKFGKNILFKNLSGEGGATLRLESGGGPNIYTAPSNILMDDIYARDISCTNGRCAVMMSPHTRTQGYVNVDGVYANGCGFAATISAGYVAAKETEIIPETGLPPTPGIFDSDSVVVNVHADYGENAQYKSKHFKYIPCEVRDQVAPLISNHKDIFSGPSAACVVYTSEGSDPGSYSVNMSNITHSGFTYQPKTVVTAADQENCTLPVSGVTVMPDAVDVLVSNTVQLAVAIDPWLAANHSVSWGSDAPEVATVDSEGRVTVHGEGQAVISATTQDGGFVDGCTVQGVPWATLLLDDDFESPENWGNWVSGGEDAVLTSNLNHVIETQGVQVRDDSSTSHIQLSAPLDLSAYSELLVSFSVMGYRLDEVEGEGVRLQYSDDGGSTWSTVKTLVVGTDFNNDYRTAPIVIIRSDEVSFISNVKLRFAAVQTGVTVDSEYVLLDNIFVSARVSHWAWNAFVDRYELSGIQTNDTDGDGLADWREYVFGGNPTNPADIGMNPRYDASTGEYIYSLVGDNSLRACILTNTNLMSGSWQTNATINIPDHDGQLRSYSNSVLLPTKQLFMKLQVEQ